MEEKRVGYCPECDPERCDEENTQPLEGPESPFEAFRGEGWCDDILLPPPGFITPVAPSTEEPTATGRD